MVDFIWVNWVDSVRCDYSSAKKCSLISIEAYEHRGQLKKLYKIKQTITWVESIVLHLRHVRVMVSQSISNSAVGF